MSSLPRRLLLSSSALAVGSRPSTGNENSNGWGDYLTNSVQISPSGDLFLYLAEEAYVRTWTEGGSVPLNAARRYLAAENKGVLTIDELSQTVYKDDNGQVIDGGPFDRAIKTPSHHGGLFVSMVGCMHNGRPIPNTHLEKRINDALILCMSTTRSNEIARKLGKPFCVRIRDFDALVNAINEGLSVDSKYGPVRYRSDRNRSHFVKGSDNSYMDEFRIVIPGRTEDTFWITVPKGIAEDTRLHVDA